MFMAIFSGKKTIRESIFTLYLAGVPANGFDDSVKYNIEDLLQIKQNIELYAMIVLQPRPNDLSMRKSFGMKSTR